MHKTVVSAFAAILGLGLAITAAAANGIEETAMTGPYLVTLKVLPAESFTGTNAEMAWDAGAQPVKVNSPAKPNHHLVAFIQRDGSPLEHATVTIRYRRVEPGTTDWQILPVARMHVAGKTLATTHYGNNVRLLPGRYTAEIAVDGGQPAVIRFTLKKHPAMHHGTH